ncbi:MAG: hypothetical protein HYU28_06335 [Actinobacteria bacterium]|nr:hypothetical protein [Actinomycetota bacterium]
MVERDTLLVIDNCEHVIDDAARIAERLLGECPRIQILATSREPLGVSGEASMRVSSLDERASVQLFLDRARATAPDFELTPDHQDAVVEVCRRLDGIPLAIELAAARVRVLTPGQIADGLADRFRLLTGGSRSALPRQRTLEASVDWSYRLLSDPERILLDRLSVFAGGFTLEAAERICADDELPESGLLDFLTALVDKSLVQVEVSRPGDDARYRLLETIRHFARQRLADGPDPGAVRDRHLGYFVEVAEDAGPQIERVHELASLDRLEADLDNLRAALGWAEQRGESEQLLRLMASLWLFYEVRCRFDEGTAWLNAALAAAPEPTATRARALHGLGDIAIFMLDMETTAAAGSEIVAIGEHLGDQALLARGATTLSWAACFGAYRDTAWVVETLGTMLASFDERENPWLYADAHTALSMAWIIEGDLRSGATAADEALAGTRRSGMLAPLQRALYFRGWIHVLAGEIDDGEAMLVQAIDLADELDDTFMRVLCLTGVAQARFLRGDTAGAEADASTSIAQATRFGNPFGVLGSLCLAFLLVVRGDEEEASSVLETARSVVEQLSVGWYVDAWFEGTTALIEAGRGDADAARASLEVIARAMEAKPHARGLFAVYLGWVERLAGDDAAAESAFTDAVEASAAAGARAEVATALAELAVSAVHRRQFERGARLLGAAEAERAALGLVPIRPVGLPTVDAELAAAREGLGDETFAVELEAGRAMSLDEAVRFALRGKGGRRRPTSGWDSLTPTEVEVVRLVSQGLSNPEVAEKLLITRGTVKAHLSHVFTKLGMASRTELAGEAARRAVNDSPAR